MPEPQSVDEAIEAAVERVLDVLPRDLDVYEASRVAIAVRAELKAARREQPAGGAAEPDPTVSIVDDAIASVERDGFAEPAPPVRRMIGRWDVQPYHRRAHDWNGNCPEFGCTPVSEGEGT